MVIYVSTIKYFLPTIIFIAFLVLILILYFLKMHKRNEKFRKLVVGFIEEFNKIELGDKKEDVFRRLTVKPCGDTLLEDGTEVYEWWINVSGDAWTGSSEGVSATTYSQGYEKAMKIKIRNGLVVEKTGNNIELISATSKCVDNYALVTLGMDRNKVLELLGEGYSISLLENGTERYSWTIRKDVSVSSVYVGSGISCTSASGGTHTTVVVVFRDKKVVEKTNAL